MLTFKTGSKYFALFLSLVFCGCPQSLVILGKIETEDNLPLDKTDLTVSGPSMFLKKNKVAANGNFELRKPSPGEYIFQIIPENHAPLIWVGNLSAETKPLKIRLHKGQTIRFRIRNTEMEPISNVEIRFIQLDSDALNFSFRSHLIGTYLHIEKSDSDGRIVWHNAPENAKYAFFHENYLTTISSDLHPIEQEHSVFMNSPITIQGMVVDSKTQEAIHSSGYEIEMEKRIELKHDNRVFEYWASNGATVFPTAPKAYTVSPNHYHEDCCRIKIIAEGYKTAVSSEFFISDGSKTFNFALEKLE